VFYLNVAYISHICLQVFYLDVAYTCNGFHVFFRCFASVSDVCCKCFICFGRMLQAFHLDVVNVNRVLHMLQCV
jgi:hypothetical protein